MKYAVEMCSGVIHIKIQKDWFRHSVVDGEMWNTQQVDIIRVLLFLAYFP
jgi:hypothetical protein